MICAYETVVCILEVGLEGDDRLGRQLFNLPLNMAYISTSGCKFFIDICKKLLRGVISAIHKRSVRLLELV